MSCLANQFGFNINWASGQVIVVESCANLTNPVWYPIQTNTLTGDSLYFNDPQWTNYPTHFTASARRDACARKRPQARG